MFYPDLIHDYIKIFLEFICFEDKRILASFIDDGVLWVTILIDVKLPSIRLTLVGVGQNILDVPTHSLHHKVLKQSLQLNLLFM